MNKYSVGLPEVEVNTFRKKTPLEAEVVENQRLFTIQDEENDARHIVLRAPGINYLEGQSVGVLTPGIDQEKNKPHSVRLYSIASVGSDMAVNDAALLDLCVKRVVYIDELTGEKRYGMASNYLCDLKVGESVQLTGPAGRNFLLPVKKEIDRPYLFFATGTGIAPFRGMLRRLFKSESPLEQDVYLFFGVKRQDELIYNKELQEYKSFSNFHYLTSCSREQTNHDGAKLYVYHLIESHKRHIANLLKNPKTLIYLCGLKGMGKGIFEKLAETLGLSGDSSKFENLISGRLFMEVY